jgi:rubrerythrin
MAGGLLKILGELLLPERYGNDQTVPKEPIEALVSVYNQLLQLAAQIESHADRAPYPHVATRLRSIAAEKRESAQQLKTLIESRHAWVSEPVRLTVSGKNHWERVGRDLADQKAFENFLAGLEPRFSTEYPQIADLLFKLRTAQVAHRETLAEIIALADPQATQT